MGRGGGELVFFSGFLSLGFLGGEEGGEGRGGGFVWGSGCSGEEKEDEEGDDGREEKGLRILQDGWAGGVGGLLVGVLGLAILAFFKNDKGAYPSLTLPLYVQVPRLRRRRLQHEQIPDQGRDPDERVEHHPE